jgi:hypothetical protein
MPATMAVRLALQITGSIALTQSTATLIGGFTWEQALSLYEPLPCAFASSALGCDLRNVIRSTCVGAASSQMCRALRQKIPNESFHFNQATALLRAGLTGDDRHVAHLQAHRRRDQQSGVYAGQCARGGRCQILTLFGPQSVQFFNPQLQGFALCAG